MEDYNIIKTDFNDISQLEGSNWNHNNCYYKDIIKLIPNKTEAALEIGCGTGQLSYMLSLKAQKVIAVDLADKMIEKAKVINPNSNIEYICGNILDMDFDNESFDIIVSSATAHHLPYEWLLCFAKEKLRKGGILIILDLVKAESLSDYIIWSLAFFPNIFMSLIKNGKLRNGDKHSQEIWERHSDSVK